MAARNDDLRDCPTAYTCRERLSALSAWMSDDDLKLIPIWRGNRFERGQEYFDLDHPERGAFVATGDEGPLTDHTYACRNEVPERVWARLVTWRQPMTEEQGEQVAWIEQHLGEGIETSAAGEARPAP